MAEIPFGGAPGGAPLRAGNLVNYAGAFVSLALVAGVGVWGYKLLVRDVTGVPVVRAMEGPMRSAPDNPGGEIALHTGLAVNAVQAQGGVAAPQDTLTLAPTQPSLPLEDLEVAPVAQTPEVSPADPLGVEADVAALDTPQTTPIDPDRPLTVEEVLALADLIAAGAAPLSDLAEGEDVPVLVSVADVVSDVAEAASATPAVIAASVPGVSRSLRPLTRPASGFPAPVITPVVATAPDSAPAAVNEAVIPAGTKLVQLGAFDSADIAASEWTRLSSSFGDYMDGKERLIQRAQSGGRTFYRLRAMGFADLSDARRFCSALMAEDAACIPVVVR
ncbi:MAG: hypothetical protein ACI86S_001859 [Paracoccaceae bacterium]|jgi:hypothetical protein